MFKQSFDIIMLAMGYDSKSSAVKMAIWLSIIGEEAVDLSEDERQDIDKGQTDSVVQDRIVLDIRDNCLQEHLLREQDLNLSKTVEQCRVAEFGKQHADVEQTFCTNQVEEVRLTDGEPGTYSPNTLEPEEFLVNMLEDAKATCVVESGKPGRKE
ncbi:hypothetical protein PR048_000991 [Dryococelus australis]|uniref:Uncharacterized protein n=1 Tax=Dryococelus australis TaxID=614101 RepID=A0ABQ9IG51_9NEOP|nr:hypothetical protein PR048_000991 [Dryococelus australis]